MTYPIDGITVLTQHEIVKTVVSGWVMVAIVFGVLSLLLLFIALVECSSGYAWSSLVFFIVFIFCFVKGEISSKEVPTDRYEYQVLIDETVDINEIALHYDIIGQDGLIWTLEDKK